jgi:AcrR family transcriptional regulator
VPESELSPRAQEIVHAARELLEEEGSDALSMRRLAARLGIQAPSIYKHLPDKRALENALVSEGFAQVSVELDAALEGTDDSLEALGVAYRAFARRHPHLYRLMTERELDRANLAPGVEDRAARPLLQALGHDQDLARAAFAFAHGMTILELNGRFPPDADLDAAWRRGLDALRDSASSGAPAADANA